MYYYVTIVIITTTSTHEDFIGRHYKMTSTDLHIHPHYRAGILLWHQLL